MHVPSAHYLLPALWLINFPAWACPTTKCSPSLCHTQSVPPLPCVSLPSLADFSSPGLWLHLSKMSGQRASPHRTSALLIYSFFSSLFSLFFFSTYLYLTWKLWLAFCHIKFMFETTAQQAFSGLIKRLSTSLLQFPLVLTSFKIVNSQLTAGQRDSLSLVSHLRCVRFLNASLGMLFTELVSALTVTPVSLTWVLWRWACCANQSDSEAGV